MTRQEMNGLETTYINLILGAVVKVFDDFRDSSIDELLNKTSYGKGDTIGIDANPEIIYKETIKEFDEKAIFITEETDEDTLKKLPDSRLPDLQPTAFISDPTDRSSCVRRFLQKITGDFSESKKEDEEIDKIFKKVYEECGIDGDMTIDELFDSIDEIKLWEILGKGPTVITGPTSSVSCVHRGRVIFSIILNFFTSDIFLACSKEIRRLNLLDYDVDYTSLSINDVIAKGKSIKFRLLEEDTSINKQAIRENSKRFVTYLGKSIYPDNFFDSMIFSDKDKGLNYIHHSLPGGPARILYQSELQPINQPIGFIMGNGEKISEWIHWLPFVKKAVNNQGKKSLKIYEIAIQRPWTKEGVLMSTSPTYSLFWKGNNPYFEINKLKNYRSPSHFRSMLVIAPSDNDWIKRRMGFHKYREVGECI